MRELLLLCLLACNGKDEPIDEGDDGGDDDDEETGGPECTSDPECASHEICEAEECVDGDRNNSAEEAEALLWDDLSSGHFLNPAGDVDYFSINAEGGEYLRLSTAIADDPDDFYNTVITLRDPDQKVVAVADNYPTGALFSSEDSILYAYLAAPGTYTVSVEDDGTYYSGGEPYGDEDYLYSVELRTWTGYTSDADEDSAEEPGFEYDFSSDDAGSYWPLGVVLEEPGDVDYVLIDFPHDNAHLIIEGMDVLPGTGSDVSPQVRLLDETGQVLLDNVPVGGGADAAYPLMAEQEYILELSDEDGGGGEDAWFFVFVSYGSEDTSYPQEAEDNGEAFLATPLELNEYSNDSGSYTTSYGLGFADAPLGELTADEDWYSLTAFEDGFLVVCMNSEVYGSSVAPDIALIDSDGATVIDEDSGGDDYPTAVIENAEVEEDTTYYLRVTHPEDAVYDPMAWYEFVIYVANFSIGNYGCPP